MELYCPEFNLSALRLRVVVPHFFQEGASERSGGYGSGRSGNRLPRSLALARCLGSVLSLNRSSHDWMINIAELQLERTPATTVAGLPGVLVELHVFVCGDCWIQEVVEQFSPRIHLHRLDLEDPRQLPLAAVRQLLDFSDPAALSLYLEDDLVIQDSRYVDKIAWFHDLTDHQFVLMPHRREPSAAHAPQHLFVDGPIKPVDQIEPVWASDEVIQTHVRFWDGQEIEFAQVANPHSGSFCISAPQLELLRGASWPPEPFIGPLETAATGTVLNHFAVLKPSLACREFLTIEHGNPSFLETLNTFPRREVKS